jgi:glycosyltransferase involved in cell wall biosynthesis
MTHLSNDAVLELVGGGDVESDLRQLVASLGLEGTVQFRGSVPRSEVPAILGTAAVGVAPLRERPELDYAVPTKVYEYMACGLPVVVTGRGEIERVVDESGGGLHAPADPEAVAARLDELLDDRARRRQMGRRGREHVRAHYDRRAVARRLGEVLADLTD